MIEGDKGALTKCSQEPLKIPNTFLLPLAERVKKKTSLVVLLVIALISLIIGVGLLIASAVLVYSKSIATHHEAT